MPLSRCKPRCHRPCIRDLAVDLPYRPRSAAVMRSNRCRALVLPPVILKAMVWPGGDQAELEAKEPAYYEGTAPLGQPSQHPVATGPGLVTDHQPGAIDTADAGGLATVAMEQEVKGGQEPRRQGHKAAPYPPAEKEVLPVAANAAEPVQTPLPPALHQGLGSGSPLSPP